MVAGPEILYVFWPIAVAYLRVSTHAAVFRSPLAPADAMANVEALIALPHVRSPGEQERFWSSFRRAADPASARGNLVPDAHLVGMMLQHDVPTIYTHDRDFRRFDGIDVVDPLA